MIESLNCFASSSTNLGSFIAGLLVFFISTFFVFFVKDVFKKPPSFSGVFYLKITTENSKKEDYKGLSSFFVLTLINESTTKVIGKIEKIYDIENTGFHRKYTGKDRNVGNVILTIERYYLRFNKANIHISLDGDPNGVQRPSSLVVSLDKAKYKTTGVFTTTAADANGIAVFQNEKFH
ncbi:hypothetical protein [Pectobacterium atrosepticum]|uniref:hypothetical protein n=1 Tax=Pectobacterium atrosepticum TaxID=29471 RepID=UPI001BFC8FC0|nr:hypothetical protein [Pectobacterium atrosepticum]QWC50545.1 hypothetical protein HLB43_07175 [Pectobacterium atrosepticum]